MRHGSALNKLSLPSAHRRSLYRNLVTSLLKAGKIETTIAKAQGLKRVADRIINLSKSDTLQHRKQAHSYIFGKAVVQKLFTEIGPKFSERNGGYTRVIRTKVRRGDAAQMALVELTCNPELVLETESETDSTK